VRWPHRRSSAHLLQADIAARGVVPLAIAGPYRSGTSLVAGICHALGAYVGRAVRTRSPQNPRGFYEAPLLAEYCRRMYAQPWLEELLDRQDRVTLLATWFRVAMDEAGDRRVIGAKHPILCLLVDDVIEAWGRRTRFIFVTRPIEEAIESLRNTKWPEWGDHPGSHEHAVRTLAQARDRAAKKLRKRCLVTHYHDLLNSPAAEVERIAQYLGLRDPEAIAGATATVDPALYRTRSDSA
jgi:hypothetical protein